MLVLLSFILSWGEVWFYDLRMIPLERKANEIWGTQQPKDASDTESDERTLLLPPTRGGMLERFMTGSTLYEGSVGNFYSPFETPENSDDEEEDLVEESGVRIPKRFRRKKDRPLSDQVVMYKCGQVIGAIMFSFSFVELLYRKFFNPVKQYQIPPPILNLALNK